MPKGNQRDAHFQTDFCACHQCFRQRRAQRITDKLTGKPKPLTFKWITIEAWKHLLTDDSLVGQHLFSGNLSTPQPRRSPSSSPLPHPRE
jgi:hypothetical protein